MSHPPAPPQTGSIPAPEQRLHPLSWLFVLLQQLKQFLLPVLILLLFGAGDGRQLWGLIAVAILVLVALWQYATFRYRIESDSLIVRSGLLERRLRQIPFARIHNVALQQSVLHRIFGVAEIRLESAGGSRPEAEMRVLKLADAHALEHLIRQQARSAAAAARAYPDGPPSLPESDTARDLLSLPLSEVMLLGVISNRGLLVVGAALAAVSQISPDLLRDLAEPLIDALTDWLNLQPLGYAQYAYAALVPVLALALLLQALSIALALLQYAGFRLTETGSRLTIERGLLTRLRTTASRRRIQAWTLKEGVFQRLFRRRALHVDIAVSRDQSEQRSFREIAPIATADTIDGLVRHVLDQADWPPRQWRALHRYAWLRLALPGLCVAALATVLLGYHVGPWGLLGLLWIPWAVLAARRHLLHAGYAWEGELIAVRAGWWSRHWRFTELNKLQALRLCRNPLDWSMGTASLWLDTSGAATFAPPLRIRFLPIADAQALQAQLGAQIARRPLRW